MIEPLPCENELTDNYITSNQELNGHNSFSVSSTIGNEFSESYEIKINMSNYTTITIEIADKPS